MECYINSLSPHVRYNSVHLILLDLVTLTTIGEDFKLSSSLRSFSLFSNTLNLCSNLYNKHDYNLLIKYNLIQIKQMYVVLSFHTKAQTNFQIYP
jgi:hypothetical protein